MNQSESSTDVYRTWYDCKSNIDIKFLNYSGNVYFKNFICILLVNPACTELCDKFLFHLCDNMFSNNMHMYSRKDLKCSDKPVNFTRIDPFSLRIIDFKSWNRQVRGLLYVTINRNPRRRVYQNYWGRSLDVLI